MYGTTIMTAIMLACLGTLWADIFAIREAVREVGTRTVCWCQTDGVKETCEQPTWQNYSNLWVRSCAAARREKDVGRL